MRRTPIGLIVTAAVATVALALVLLLDVRVSGRDRVGDAVSVARERLAAVTAEIATAVRERADALSRSEAPLAELQSIVVHVVAGHSGVSHVDFPGAGPGERQVDVVLVVEEEIDRDWGGEASTLRVGSCVRFGPAGFAGIDCGAVWELIPSKGERPQILVPGGAG
ncbi:hypothetical protein Afil01_09740 [Actinorhabdospora filicis]|uniref:Uncharacterized protein n=1 Tax=Actinorhabdospora filicis TaxID=1785913 RepID=A0A9W6SHQ9_9ACTN|nr:hypothetical protein [Actinorhabdospora filicis]GLZ76167.1 hypothetical protein Afil01_09740 [Actinorhabdospora filicis]